MPVILMTAFNASDLLGKVLPVALAIKSHYSDSPVCARSAHTRMKRQFAPITFSDFKKLKALLRMTVRNE